MQNRLCLAAVVLSTPSSFRRGSAMTYVDDSDYVHTFLTTGCHLQEFCFDDTGG